MFFNSFFLTVIQTALGSDSSEEVEKILRNICNTVVTEEDCKNQIIQDALSVSCDEELNDLWKVLIADSPSKNQKENTENKESSEQNQKINENEQEKNDSTEESSSTGECSEKKEIISHNEPSFSLQIFTDDDDDKESVMVCIMVSFFRYLIL